MNVLRINSTEENQLREVVSGLKIMVPLELMHITAHDWFSNDIDERPVRPRCLVILSESVSVGGLIRDVYGEVGTLGSRCAILGQVDTTGRHLRDWTARAPC